MNVAIRVVKYARQSLGLGVFMSANTGKQLIKYCDVDWTLCPNIKKYIISYLVTYNNSLISWKSKKQNIEV